MRNNTTLAIWLALIMLLLVGAAAVFFLAQRNTQLEADLQRTSAVAEGTRVALAATRDQLSSDITVRQAALDAASATRDTLAAEAELNAGRAQELASSLTQQEDSLARAQATLQSLALQVFIIAPADEAEVPPLESLDIMASARSDAGLSLVSVTVDGQQIAELPADGQNKMNVRASWTPLEEASYVIAVKAFAVDGRSQSAEVTVDAVFASDEARQIALLRQLEEAARAERFPAPPAADENAASDAVSAIEAASADEDKDALLHQQLLTGRLTDDEQVSADKAVTLQALELIISEAAYQAYLNNVVQANLYAFFDPETENLTVYEPGDQGGAFSRWLSVHKLAHQEQRDRLGLDELDLPAMDADQLLAIRALVEGDAAFLQYRLLADEVMSEEEVDDVRAGLADSATDALAALPTSLQESFAFAYDQGVPFVQALYDQGGYAVVDGAWRELPVSSEQILHPERYLTGEMPLPVSLASLGDSLGSSWRLVDEDTFGEFLLRQHLGRQPLTSGQIDLAATGWGGGRYAVYQSTDNEIPVVLLRLVWDSEDDANEFTEVYSDYLSRRFGGEETGLDGGRCWQADGVGCLFQIGTDSVVVRAPTLELAQTAAGPQLNMNQP